MPPFICIGVPYWLGERREERTEVYSARDSGITAELGAQWVDIQPDFSTTANPVNTINRALAETIAAHPEHLPLIFASDCTGCLGAMKGFDRYQPGVLWYDAHGDFNTPETTISGFLGGMPLAALVGRGNRDLLDGIGLSPVSENAVTITDARNLDPAEGVALANSQVTHLKRVDELLNANWGGKPLYIHFDTDVVDSSEIPALNYPEPNGPTIDETAATLRHVQDSARVVGVLFSLWNDTLPSADTALRNTLRLVRVVAQSWNNSDV